jgi:transposase
VALVGPVADDNSWQAQAPEGYGVARFVLDWDKRQATCPQGRTSTLWIAGHDRHGHEIAHIRFARPNCQACPVRANCTHSPVEPRTLTVRPREYHEALPAARQRQATEAFQHEYASRAGVEGTISQGVRIGDLRRSRYVGLAKTRLQHFLTAAALNLVRLGAWLADTPREQTRRSPFTALAGAI